MEMFRKLTLRSNESLNDYGIEDSGTNVGGVDGAGGGRKLRRFRT